MNARARQLGLRDTSYANPIGLDDPRNRSSARDLATLARLLMRDERFAAIVRRESAVLESGARRRVVHNRNDLVGRVPGVDGVKTGHTRDARYVLVGSATGRLGGRVISVVMGEPGEAARDTDSVALLRFGLGQFRRVKALDSDRAVASASIAHRDERARLVPQRDALVLARRGQKVTTRVDAPDELEGEIAAGQKVGAVAVLRDGKVVRRVPLVTAAEVPGAGPLRVLVDELGTFLTVVLIGVILAVAAMGLTRTRSRRRDKELADRRRARERAQAGG
jgi:D-alanyl-D-alanine carboxypeptidase (penicillin-binding protein 5/6)